MLPNALGTYRTEGGQAESSAAPAMNATPVTKALLSELLYQLPVLKGVPRPYAVERHISDQWWSRKDSLRMLETFWKQRML